MYGKKIFVLKGDMLNAHFYKYAKKVVYQFDFFKDEFTPQKQNEMLISRCCLRT